ncbi:hypothetical protein GJ744_006874 [Endocarpon pusillum]|uniref:Transaldolase n=1 Tax=Endocarpon pusillum TaxID=364733 RepID=A0A8H7ABG5_9EURO|nr:hypothetical protein GJ744_006874 [Endocarpon pusillum]
MGSIAHNESTVNVLEYVRSKSQVDVDSLDIGISDELGPFVDCTSNQADAYAEISQPQRATVLHRSVALAKQILSEFPYVTFEELAFEISMVSLSLSIAPKIKGSILVMSNPLYCHSTPKIVENGHRLAEICHRLEPNFDLSRLCIKVASTWEGLQACRKLKELGIKTLATTLFTMEQAVLAAEVGCVSVSPFVHELKVHFDETYHDTDPIFDLCVEAQQYYKQHSYSTKVKACSVISMEEVLQLAGVAAFTIPPELLRELATSHESEQKLADLSLFQTPQIKNAQRENNLQSFVDDEAKFRIAFTRRDDGKGQMKTIQAINIFCDCQIQAEQLMRETEAHLADSGA